MPQLLQCLNDAVDSVLVFGVPIEIIVNIRWLLTIQKRSFDIIHLTNENKKYRILPFLTPFLITAGARHRIKDNDWKIRAEPIGAELQDMCFWWPSCPPTLTLPPHIKGVSRAFIQSHLPLWGGFLWTILDYRRLICSVTDDSNKMLCGDLVIQVYCQNGCVEMRIIVTKMDYVTNGIRVYEDS